MDSYLSQYLTFSCICEIYSYYGWHALRRNPHVPRSVWKQIYDNFYTDIEFRDTFNVYKYNGDCDISFKQWILHYLNHLVFNGVNIPNILWSNVDFVILILRNKGMTIWDQIPIKLRTNPNIIRIAVNYDHDVVLHLGDDLKHNNNFMMNIVATNGLALKYVPTQNDSLIKTALHENGLALQYVTCQNKELVMMAVEQNGKALQYVSAPWNTDREVVMAAAVNFPGALGLTAPVVYSDDEFMYTLLKKQLDVFPYASEKIRSDPDTVLSIIKERPDLFEYAVQRLKATREFVIRLMKINFKIIRYIDDTLKADPKIILFGVRVGHRILDIADNKLKADANFMLKAIKLDASCISHACKQLQCNKNFIVRAFLVNPDVWMYNSALFDDKEIEKLVELCRYDEWCLDIID